MPDQPAVVPPAAVPPASPAWLCAHRLAAGGSAVAWREAGDPAAPPLLLLHGIGSSAESWRPLLPWLGGRFRVLAWDAPGYGGSDPLPVDRPRTVEYARMLLAGLEALEPRPLAVLGHSLGALMAGGLARLAPARVRSLVLADPANGYGCPTAGPWPEGVTARIEDLARQGPEAFAAARAVRLCAPDAPESVVAAVRREMARVRLPGYAQAAALLAQGDLAADLAELAHPVLVTCGSEDRVVPEAKARQVAAARPDIAYATLPGVGHAGYVENPEVYLAPVLPFLTAVRSGLRSSP